MKLATVAVTIAVLSPVVLAASEEMSLTAGEWALKLDAAGRITSLADKNGRELVQPGLGDNSLELFDVASNPKAAAAVKTERLPNGARLEMESTGLPLRVDYRIEFTASREMTVLKRTVKLIPQQPITSNIALVMGNNIAPARKGRKVFLPRQNGRGEEIPMESSQLERVGGDGGTARRCVWKLNGEPPWSLGGVEALAIPMISDSAPDGLRITHVADPFFTTGFHVASTPHPPHLMGGPYSATLSCVYEGTKVPLMIQPFERTFWTVIHSGGAEEAMKAWYATALADIPAGPEWLHEIAWQHYDYLSYGGKGWFEDIEAAERLISKEERHKVIFTLHGWYDVLGRYTLNPATGKLDDEWTAFPSAPAVRDRFPHLEPLKMNKVRMHRRIQYAKERGFRVCIYFADGMAACDGVKDIFSPDEVLSWGGWQGPDTIGKTYNQNPAHPKVKARFLKYLEALLDEYGGEIDALVWDETFHVRAGTVSGGESPAYAAEAMMRLVRECTKIVSRKQPRVAFMVSDDVGLTTDGKSFWTDVPPYAIMAHGCYQDSHSRPEVWPWGIFPNYRNVLWSCNWQAVTRFDYTAFGVKHYQTPLATTNGWLDNKGIARLSSEQRDGVLALFHQRKNHRQELRWLTGPPPAFK